MEATSAGLPSTTVETLPTKAPPTHAPPIEARLDPSPEQEQKDFSSSINPDGSDNNHVNNDHSAPPRPAIARSETKAVKRLKILVFVVLALFAVGVALAVYYYITKSEIHGFEEQFHDDARQVLASLGASLDRSLGAIDSLVVQVVSMAHISNQTWPMVTIPNLEVRMGKIRQLANGVVIIMYPLVADDQRADWEAYSASHGTQWVEESLDIQERTPSHFTGPILRDYPTWNVIHRNDEYEKENGGEFGTTAPGPYLPQWQHSPVIPCKSI